MRTAGGARGPELRIADSDREAAVAALGDHYAAGRLTKEEFDERADAAWAARTASGLWPLFADLPRPAARRPGLAPVPPLRADAPAPRGSWLPSSPWLVVLLVGVALVRPELIVLPLLVWVLWSRVTRSGWHATSGAQRGHGGYRRPPHRLR